MSNFLLSTFLGAVVASANFINANAGEALVIDGDTIELDGQNFRLHGIDAPEAGQKCSQAGGGYWRCGDTATEALVKLVAGKDLQCDNRGQGRLPK